MAGDADRPSFWESKKEKAVNTVGHKDIALLSFNIKGVRSAQCKRLAGAMDKAPSPP